MCVEVIQESRPTARKDHICNASEILYESLPYMIDEMSFKEKRAVVKARRNKWHIKKSAVYVRQVNKMDGEVYTFKAIPDIHQICIDHDLYC